ncbi:hypothetical protein D3C71_1798190 [compost metagenome]
MINAPIKVEGTGLVASQVSFSGSKFSTSVGWVETSPPIKPAGKASLPPIELATKAENIGIAKLNSSPPKDSVR